MNNPLENKHVRAALVPNEHVLELLRLHIGSRLMIRGQSVIYGWLSRISKDYNGAHWQYYDLSNGGFYAAPQLSKPLHVVVPYKGFSQTMSADAAGIVATSFALDQLSSELQTTDVSAVLEQRYHLLQDYVANHAESAAIFALTSCRLNNRH